MTCGAACDAISIAGIVRMVRKEFGLKPVINTNELALTPELLRELKKAGLHGLPFHVDSIQTRPGWKGATEEVLCELRLRFARMVAAKGGLGCNLNMTVFRRTLREVPTVLDRAARHAPLRATTGTRWFIGVGLWRGLGPRRPVVAPEVGGDGPIGRGLWRDSATKGPTPVPRHATSRGR